LTPAETREFTSLLRTMESELTCFLCHNDEIVTERASDKLDEVELERELFVNLARESTILRQIRGALSRIADGTFGVCLRCEEDISPKRMAAVPWAGYCIKCQEKIDRGAVALGANLEWLARAA
jgi:DnaK suppressor protein